MGPLFHIPKAPAKPKATKDATSTEGAPAPKQREGTRMATVLALLERAGGATLEQIVSATSWQKHSVCGFISTRQQAWIQGSEHSPRDRQGALLLDHQVTRLVERKKNPARCRALLNGLNAFAQPSSEGRGCQLCVPRYSASGRSVRPM